MPGLRTIQIALTTLAIVVLAWLVDWRAFAAAVVGADPALLIMTLVLLIGQRFLMAGKWAHLMRVHGVRLGLLDSWGVYSAGALAGAVLPASAGGDAVRVAWLWRRGIDAHQSAASVVIEKVLGALVGLGFAAVGIVILSHDVAAARDLGRWLPVVLGAGVLVAAGLLAVLFYDPTWLRRLPFGARVSGLVDRFRAALRRYGRHPGVLLVFLGLTVLENLWTFLVTWVSALALGIDVSPLHIAAAIAVTFVITRLPISIDGIGVMEGTLALVLGLLGVPAAQSVALAVIGRVLVILSNLPGAAYAALRPDLRLGAPDPSA
jgi:uncharacterized membrane protein YbhN (UPF0104 family)